jgi:transcriptional regulator with XRE-family HTH domain
MTAVASRKPSGETILRLRTIRGMGLAALSREAGVTEATLVALEHATKIPRPSTLRKVAKALGVEVTDLYREPDEAEARVMGAGSPVPLGAALAHVLREMQQRYAPGRTLDWSREDLERVAARTDEATLAQFALEFEVGNDSLAQEIAQTGAAVCALLRARAQRAPTQSTKTARAAAQAVEQKLAGMAPTAA